jgi:pimeloyl-ACP methyl ester carboxylesterase
MAVKIAVEIRSDSYNPCMTFLVRHRQSRPLLPAGLMRNRRIMLSTFLFLFAAIAHADEEFACAGAQVGVVQVTLNGVPAILRVPRVVTKRPIVLWHGFGAPNSEAELMKALPLDDVPSVKVYVGLPLFGARAPALGDESIAQRQAQDYGSQLFEPAVLGAAQELPAVVRALRQRKCLGSDGEIGLFGFSAGGTAVLYALVKRDVPVRAAVTINSPVGLTASIDTLERATKHQYAWTAHTRELAEHSDAIRHAAQISAGTPALLLIHGADDTVVTPEGATFLRSALQPFYHQSGGDKRLQLLLEPGVSHDWTQPRARSDLRAAVADWFNSYL